MLVLVVTLVIYDTPPQKTAASSVNKQAQQTVPTVQQVAKPVEPAKTVEPQPQPEIKPEPATYAPGCRLDLLQKYDWNVQVMAAICQAESGGNPYAVGDTRTIGGIYAPSCGLMQIRTLQGRPTCEQLQNPETNIEWAYKIYKGQGYPAWSVCKTKVRCY